MKFILLFVFILPLNSCSTDRLQNVCQIKCYSGPEEHAGIGLCKIGLTACDETGKRTDECFGEVLATDEVCDGLDNNCNGFIDEWYLNEPLMMWNTEGTCKQDGVCYTPNAHCNNGTWICEYPSIYEEKEISCDGLDNDCNGLIDDMGPRGACFGNMNESEWWRATNPPCHLGVEMCNSYNGMWECMNPVIPGIEYCNRIDDDCDGLIDNNTIDNTSLDYDIVFIIDDSASMCEEIFATAEALKEYVEQFDSNPNFRFALVLITGGQAKVDIIFGNLFDIINRLIEIGTNCNGNGFCEASLDSMYEVCDSSDPLNLKWRIGAGRLFFAFTDEGPQSCYSVDNIISYDDVIEKCNESLTLSFIWYNHDISGFNNSGAFAFNYICQEIYGSMSFELSDNKQEMLDNMNSIVDTLCGI